MVPLNLKFNADIILTDFNFISDIYVIQILNLSMTEMKLCNFDGRPSEAAVFAGVLQYKCSDKFLKILNKTPALEPFFHKVAAKVCNFT